MPITNINLLGSFKPLRRGVLVRKMHFGMKETVSGIIIPDDDKIERGIHPRWAEVIAVGDNQEDVEIGQWVLVKHGRWSRGFELNEETVRTVDPDDILMVTDDEPKDEHYTFAKEN